MDGLRLCTGSFQTHLAKFGVQQAFQGFLPVAHSDHNPLRRHIHATPYLPLWYRSDLRRRRAQKMASHTEMADELRPKLAQVRLQSALTPFSGGN